MLPVLEYSESSFFGRSKKDAILTEPVNVYVEDELPLTPNILVCVFGYSDTVDIKKLPD